MENSTSSNSSMYYVLGAIVLVAVIGAGYMMRPKTPVMTPEQQAASTAPKATPTPLGPISRLSCDTQYYNPIIGFAKYYISIDGSDVSSATTVECETTITQENKVVATERASATLTPNEARGGKVFKCSTPGLDLKPSIPTKVEVALKDDQGAKASCSAVFALPRP